MKKLLLLVLTLTMITCLCLGLTACAGKDGANGQDGVSIVDVYVSDDGYLMIKYSNSETYVNVGKVTDDEEQGTIGLKYVLNEDGKSVSVDGIGMAFERDIVIPSTYKGYPVTAINTGAFLNCFSVTSITIPNSVTVIQYAGITGCENLKKIIYTGTIDEWVQIEFEESLNGDVGVEEFCINNELLTTANITTATKINNYAFYGFDSLTSVTIGDSVTSIEYAAFRDCAKLTSITIPDSVISIGNHAFSSCDKLTSIMIPDSVISIGNYAFSSCDNLTSVTIGNSVTNIGDNAFYVCNKLVEVINKSPSITVEKGGSANGYLGCYALEVFNSNDTYVNKFITDSNGYITYNDGTDKILVNYVGTLTNLTLPNGITKIRDNAFEYCDNLTSVVIGDSVTNIGDNAFKYCHNLTSIIIPNSVTSIGHFAFSSCHSLTSVVIGNGVTSIGSSAFSYCDSITSITFEDPSTWYRVESFLNWQNKTGGTEIDVTNPSSNATYFKPYGFDSYYLFYKL